MGKWKTIKTEASQHISFTQNRICYPTLSQPIYQPSVMRQRGLCGCKKEKQQNHHFDISKMFLSLTSYLNLGP